MRMLAKDLRDAVLQAAVSGKLSVQKDNESVDSIFSSIKNEYMKKYGEVWNYNESHNTDDSNYPFPIPAKWVWIRLEKLLKIQPSNGKSTRENVNGRIKNLSLSATTSGYFDETAIKMVDFDDATAQKYYLKKNDILVQRSNSRELVGTSCVYEGKDDRFVYPDLMMRMHLFEVLDVHYIDFVLKSPFTREYYSRAAIGTSESMPKINQKTVKNTMIPLPPAEEQRRIVDKLSQILPLVDEYEKMEQKLVEIKAQFPSNIQDSILQAAMQGKITEQVAEDGSAEELYQQIQEKKERLIKEGKIRKSKPLPEISKDEILFDIPDNWRWCRLAELGEMIGGGTPRTHVDEYWRGGTIPWITPADMNDENRYISYGGKNITEEGLNKSSAQIFPKGSVIISSRAPIGYIKIAEKESTTSQGCKTFSAYDQTLFPSEFVYYLMRFRTPDLILRASGTTFKEISGRGIGETVIPLPPLSEQKRIVDRLNALLPLCERML